MADSIKIYTDGACSGNPGPGGIGIVILSGDKEKHISAGYKVTTNNRMELLAVIEALNAVDTKNNAILIFSDSQYICNAINDHWIDNWQRNSWKTANKKPVKNKDLWTKLIELIDGINITFKWVRGHSGDRYNELADKLAQEASLHPKEEDKIFQGEYNPLGI